MGKGTSNNDIISPTATFVNQQFSLMTFLIFIFCGLANIDRLPKALAPNSAFPEQRAIILLLLISFDAK